MGKKHENVIASLMKRIERKSKHKIGHRQDTVDAVEAKEKIQAYATDRVTYAVENDLLNDPSVKREDHDHVYCEPGLLHVNQEEPVDKDAFVHAVQDRMGSTYPLPQDIGPMSSQTSSTSSMTSSFSNQAPDMSENIDEHDSGLVLKENLSRSHDLLETTNDSVSPKSSLVVRPPPNKLQLTNLESTNNWSSLRDHTIETNFLTEQNQNLVHQYLQTQSASLLSVIQQIHGQYYNQILDKDNELDQIRSQNSMLQSQNRVLVQQLHDTKVENGVLVQQVDSINIEYSRQITKYTKELDRLNMCIEELQEKLIAAQRELNTNRKVEGSIAWREIQIPGRRATIYFDEFGNKGLRVPETQIDDVESNTVIEAGSITRLKDMSKTSYIHEPKDANENQSVSTNSSPTDISTKPPENASLQPSSYIISESKQTDKAVIPEITTSNPNVSKRRSHESVINNTQRDGGLKVESSGLRDGDERMKKSPKMDHIIIPSTIHQLSSYNVNALEVAPTTEKENPYKRKSTGQLSSSRLSDASNTAIRDMAMVSNHNNKGMSTNNKPSGPVYKYNESVRGKKERAKLQGYSCDHCKAFIDCVCDAPGGELIDRKALINLSRHRCRFPPDQTPEGFWNLSFADEKKSSKTS